MVLPLDGSVPLQLPEATQLVASIEDQASVVEAPRAIDVAPNVSVGTTSALSARMNP